LLAARSNALMPAIALARGPSGCATERATPLSDFPGLVVVLAQPGNRDRRQEAEHQLHCRSFAWGLLCSAQGDPLPDGAL
jgi:hypothetical protein